ncbi:MAG: NrdH-redoxin [Acidimicrobiaceae bacterium]|nr:NrdH-redoxin [Acidimicrobiaceae bacterium]
MPISATPLTVIGADWCPDCQRTKAFLANQSIEYEWIDVDTNPEAATLVENLNAGNRTIPTVIFSDGTHLAEPSNDELVLKLGL